MNRFEAARRVLAAALACLAATNAVATEVTVYNQNIALVKEVRPLELKTGLTELKLVDVAALIDPTSVHFKSLTAPDAVRVVEQNYQYDLMSPERLMHKYVGKEIELERMLGVGGERREIVRGTLLSNAGGRIMKIDGKIYVNPAGNPILPELPEGLLSKPTLLWQLQSRQGGKHDCEISYLTDGLNWHSDYVLLTDPEDKNMDLTAWVTVDNNSGATYKDARLKLVAGDVHRAPASLAQSRLQFAAKARAMDSVNEAQFAEKAFFEYHMYTLQRPTTLRENETKQIEMASAAGVPLKKLYIYDGVSGVQWSEFSDYYRTDANYGTAGQKKVWVMLEFKNSKANNLGIPLPAGKMRVYKKDADGSVQLIGEDAIDHTPKDETLRIRMGNAFDIVGERKRTNFRSDVHNRWFEESFEVKLRNHKDSDVTVRVVEHLYRWTNWRILDSEGEWKKKDAQTIEFDVPVKKDGESVVSYTVKYSW